MTIRRTRHLPLWGLTAVLTLLQPATRAWAQDLNFDKKPPAVGFVAPDGSFALKHPQNWRPAERPGQRDFVQFQIVGAPDAFVEVRHFGVGQGSRPKQMVLRAREDRLRKLPHFRQDVLRDLVVNQAPGASILGTYWYQGNAQFPRTVEEVFVVVGTDAFAFHFECFAPMAPMLAPELNSFYLSLVPHPGSQPAAPPSGDQKGEDPWVNLPF